MLLLFLVENVGVDAEKTHILPVVPVLSLFRPIHVVDVPARLLPVMVKLPYNFPASLQIILPGSKHRFPFLI